MAERSRRDTAPLDSGARRTDSARHERQHSPAHPGGRGRRRPGRGDHGGRDRPGRHRHRHPRPGAGGDPDPAGIRRPHHRPVLRLAQDRGRGRAVGSGRGPGRTDPGHPHRRRPGAGVPAFRPPGDGRGIGRRTLRPHRREPAAAAGAVRAARIAVRRSPHRPGQGGGGRDRRRPCRGDPGRRPRGAGRPGDRGRRPHLLHPPGPGHPRAQPRLPPEGGGLRHGPCRAA